jgi:stress response protein YsnF
VSCQARHIRRGAVAGQSDLLPVSSEDVQGQKKEILKIPLRDEKLDVVQEKYVQALISAPNLFRAHLP